MLDKKIPQELGNAICTVGIANIFLWYFYTLPLDERVCINVPFFR